MNKCVVCKRNATQKRKLGGNNVCSECTPPVALPPSAVIDESQSMGEITFSDFKKWITTELMGLVQSIVVKQLESTTKELEELKNKNKELEKKLAAAETRLDKAIGDQGKTVTANTESCKKNKTVSDNSLKYLINLDRNTRRRNVIMFGVPESDDLEIGDDIAEDDEEKRNLIFEYMGCSPDNLSILDCYRLGKVGENPRPLKVMFLKKEMSDLVLSKSAKLKELKDNEDLNVYVKPDKTKGEQAEFKRLGDKKKELLLQYPTPEGRPARVVLEKGILKVDGTEVDKYEPKQTLF